MAGAQAKFGGSSRVGKPRAPDLRGIFGRIEEDAFDIGKGGKIARSRPDGPLDDSKSGGRAGGGRRFAALDLTLQQRINAARRLPPAIVKVIRNGQTGARSELQNQLNYLTREGELSLTMASGEQIDSPETMAEVMRMWGVDFDATNWKHKTTHLLVSSPQGTDPEIVWRAAERFASKMFEGGQGESWDYAKIAHNDTDYPHVHFVVNNLGLETGEQFKVWRTHRINVPMLRTAWADAARAEGLELDDTPRRARGLPPSRMKTPDRQMAEEGEVSTYYLKRAATEITAAAEGRVTKRAKTFIRAFSGILEAERSAYRATAQSLRAGAALLKSDDMRRDADLVDAFADQMGMPQTDGERVVAQLRETAAMSDNAIGPEAFRDAAMTMLKDTDGKGWRVMSAADQARQYTADEISTAVQKQIAYSEQIVQLVDDPERRVRLSAQLGTEKIKLAGLANRPDWAEGEGAEAADRPVAIERARLAVATSDAGEARIMAEADRAAMTAFEIAGVDPEAALHRIRYAGPVDKATAQQWRTEEVEESLSARATTPEDATLVVNRAHEAAFAAYNHAAKRLRSHAPVNVSGDTEAARAVQAEQQDMSLKADLAEETARKSRKMKL
jgi:hypothetical protein